MVGGTKACVRTISVEKGRVWEESGVIEDMVCLHSQADPDKKKTTLSSDVRCSTSPQSYPSAPTARFPR
jgi:hypothetical protein